MITTVDEKKGLVKVYWQDVRHRVALVEPTFTKIVDALNPDKNFPLFLAYYRFGETKGDTHSAYIPDLAGISHKLTDSNLPKEIIQHLGYGRFTSPLGMSLEKCFELFVDLPDMHLITPWTIYSPGEFFPLTRILGKKINHVYAPNSVLTVSSGARSIFMLPNIGCSTHHINLQRDLKIQHPAPRSFYDHWHIFKEICDSPIVQSDWRSCMMYFSENWINKMFSDPSWLKLKNYLLELAWHRFEYERNRIYYDIAFSVIQKKRNLKPDPYLADTARHLFSIAAGAAPGYIPASNDDALPVKIIEDAYVNSYGLKKYFPVIFQPYHFNFEQDSFPIYYSYKNPSTYIFSPKSRADASTIFAMHELEHIMRTCQYELSKNDNICSDTIIGKISRAVNFRYFHNEYDRHHILEPSYKIEEADHRFKLIQGRLSLPKAKFAADAPFVRGCISINSKANDENP